MTSSIRHHRLLDDEAGAVPDALAVPITDAAAAAGAAVDAAGAVVDAAGSAAGAAGSAAADVAASAATAVEAVSEKAAEVAEKETVSEPVAARRGRHAEVVAIGGLIGFVGIFAIVRARRSEAIDLALTMKLQRRAHPIVDRVMAAASWLGFPRQSHVVPPLLIGGLALTRQWPEAAFQLAGWGSAAVSTFAKWLMKRPRPVAGRDLRVVAARLGGSSFPSGHVITYMGTYGFTAYLAHSRLRDRAARKPIVAGLVALLALVGPSRIYQGHHWPTDVTASYLLGTSYLIGLVEVYRRIKAHEARTESALRRRTAG